MIEFQFDRARWFEDQEGMWLCIPIPRRFWEAVTTLINNLSGMYTAILKKYRQKRSLDANAYLWALLEKLAAALETGKDELYLEVLQRYGVFTHIIVKPQLVDRVRREWRTVRELGEVTVNGKTGVQLQCYFGSSTYDTAEMSRLLKGVVSECQECGIETMTPGELRLLEEGWGAQADKS